MSFLDKIKALPAAYDNNAANEALKQHSSLKDKRWQNVLAAIYGNSPYLAKNFSKHISIVKQLEKKDVDKLIEQEIGSLDKLKLDKISKPELMTELRLIKQKVALLVALADISGVFSLKQTTKYLSELADKVISSTAQFLSFMAVKNKYFNKPQDSKYFVLALGKLGGNELNYSSDVDLVIMFDKENKAYKGSISIQQFYINFTNEFTEILEKFTAEGYVFRVDLRLRPDPLSTPVAVATSTAIQYYQTVGQNWERCAMIKQRFIIGNNSLYKEFNVKLQAFTWRKHLDYDALKDIHSIKRQINASQNYNSSSILGHNIKTGKGGIREIEFYVQVQQLIWGGRDAKLKYNQTLPTLHSLEQGGYISAKAASQLADSYIFFRNLEHRMQMQNDSKTHSVPEDMDKAAAVAIFLGYKNFAAFQKDCLLHIKTVQQYYYELFKDQHELSVDGNLVFTGVTHDIETLNTISKLGFKEPERISEIIRGWHFGRRRSTRTKSAREILTEITPDLLKAFGKSSFADLAFNRFDMFLGNISSGMQLFSLFEQKPEVIKVFAQIMGGSYILSEILSRTPKLVNSILTSEYLMALKSIDDSGKELDKSANTEALYENLRLWKNKMVFENGIRAIQKTISQDDSQLHLTQVAEIVVSRVYRDLTNQKFKDSYAIVALGNFGTRELTHGSDLDLVLVYKDKKQAQHNNFGRQLISILEKQSSSGKLYKIDTRLRPYGEQGSLVCSLDNFKDYYQKEAWVWEQLALTKGRVIVGNKRLVKELEQIIAQFHTSKKDNAELVKRTNQIHQKVMKEKYKDNLWDIKNIAGGLFDLELMTQYIILLHSHKYNELALANNRDILDIAGKKRIITAGLANKLTNIHRNYKAIQSALRLILKEEIFVEEEASIAIKQQITSMLGHKDFNELKNHINKQLEFVKNNMDKVIK